jgi:hypothetical protein
MTTRKVNIFDKIGTLIPGYNGYVARDEKRNDEKKFRDELSRIINQSETLIEKHQQQLIKTGEINLCKEWEVARKAVNTIFTKVKNATYGESSFFSNNQIKETELDEIYNIDYEMAERVHLIFKTLDSDINEVMNVGLIINQVKEIDNILNKRTIFINKHK